MLKRDIEPRLYQQTIFNTATMKNTLVVLPTGMGKTLIAELVAIHRLQHYPGSKILLLAPTRPLVQQHAATFAREVEIDPGELAVFTGTMAPAKRAQLWAAARIVFSTPQGLENDLLSSRISLADVSLLVVDEAHRAVGEYSYVFIADRYRKTATHERILALTASPGSDKESIAEVCANLGIEEIEVRSSESPDVQPYIQEIEIEHIKVEMPPEFKQVHGALLRCHEQRIDELRTLGVNGSAVANKTGLLRAQAALHAQAARGQRSFEGMKSMSVLAEALKVQHAIELIETQGATALTKYVEKLRKDAAKGQSKAVQNIMRDVNFKAATLLLEKVQERKLEHPKLRALQKAVLRTTYADPEAKVIVFNQYRDQAVRIKEAMDAINVPARIFVGQMKKGDTGMSQKEQQAILESFRNGGFNCLIATSVAEEGLDIPKVDVVIFYEPVPSAIRTVQRRGRTGRLARGRVIMLVTEGTRDTAHKWSAHHKEKRMYRVLDEVKRTLVAAPREERAALPAQGVTIIADHREKAGGVLKELIGLGVTIDLQQLDVADYRLSDRVVVEYKTVPDFVNSIIDGRLLSQLRGLRSFPRPIIVIEGTEDLYAVRNVHPNAILGMFAAITVSYNIPVLFTRDPRETAALLNLIAKKELEHGHKEHQLHTQKPLTDQELQEFIVASLPGVGSGLAKRLLAHFRTVRNLVDADVEALAAVEKIGKKKAEQLFAIFNREYRDA